MKRFFFLITLFAGVTAQARPLFLEPAATVGRMTFESTLSISERWDAFGSPQSDYLTTSFPITLRVGLHRRFDLGITVQHVSHRIETQGLEFSGSASGRSSPEFKFALRDNVSIQGIWHMSSNEENQELPIARGDSPELRLLAAVPTSWPLCVDIGYLRQARYNGRLGIQGTQLKNINPGDIADARLALLIPLQGGFTASVETIYSSIGDEEIDGLTVVDSGGEALDAFLGLSWTYKDLVLGLGAGTGLLDESHTSFAIDRGAGDFIAKFLFSYKLQPRKAGS